MSNTHSAIPHLFHAWRGRSIRERNISTTQGEVTLAHGDVVRWDSTNSLWVKALANTIDKAESLGVVDIFQDGMDSGGGFCDIVTEGEILNLPNTDPGPPYFLSETTEGGYTTTAPCSGNKVIKAINVSTHQAAL